MITQIAEQEELTVDTRLDNKTYYPVSACFRPLAKVRFDAYLGEIVLSKGSIIRLPKEELIESATSRELDQYVDIMQRLFVHCWRGDLKDIGNREFKVVGDIRERDPSILASMISGEITGGWDFFLGIDELTGLLTHTGGSKWI